VLDSAIKFISEEFLVEVHNRRNAYDLNIP